MKLARRRNCLRLIWSLFSPFSPLFWLFLRLMCEVIDPCFIHGYESTENIGFITVKHRQTLDWNIPTTLFLFHCELTRHPSCAQLSHVYKFSVNMRCTALFVMPTMSASWRTFSLRSYNTILWIFFTISVVVTSFGRSLRCSSWQLVLPRLNSSTQYFIIVNEEADSSRVEFSSTLLLVELRPSK